MLTYGVVMVVRVVIVTQGRVVVVDRVLTNTAL